MVLQILFHTWLEWHNNKNIIQKAAWFYFSGFTGFLMLTNSIETKLLVSISCYKRHTKSFIFLPTNRFMSFNPRLREWKCWATIISEFVSCQTILYEIQLKQAMALLRCVYIPYVTLINSTNFFHNNTFGICQEQLNTASSHPWEQSSGKISVAYQSLRLKFFIQQWFLTLTCLYNRNWTKSELNRLRPLQCWFSLWHQLLITSEHLMGSTL